MHRSASESVETREFLRMHVVKLQRAVRVAVFRWHAENPVTMKEPCV